MNRSLGGYLRCFVFAILLVGVNDGLAAERNQGKSWAATKLSVPRVGAPGFKRLKSAATGIDFQNLLGTLLYILLFRA